LYLLITEHIGIFKKIKKKKKALPSMQARRFKYAFSRN